MISKYTVFKLEIKVRSNNFVTKANLTMQEYIHTLIRRLYFYYYWTDTPMKQKYNLFLILFL